MKKALFILAVLVLLCTACQKQEEGIQVTIGPEDVIDETGTTPADQTDTTETPVDNIEETPAEETPAEETETTPDETPEETSETEDLGEIKCDEKQTIGYIGCADMDTYAELSIKNAGRIDLSGVHIRYLDSDDNILEQETEKFEFVVGDSKVLNLSILEQLKQINVYPMSNGDVCINKPTVIKPQINCR